jgi:outer membrane protein assembly factor BamC
LLCRICLVPALILLPGCSWLLGDEGFFPDRSDDYARARVEDPLRMPQGVDDSKMSDIYVIPPISEDVAVQGSADAPRPSPLVAGSSDEMVRIQKLGSDEWVLVSVAPGQLWPQVRGFLSATQQPVARIEARAGVIETGWLDDADGGMRERYQFRIEQGVQRETAELHVLQMFEAGDVNSWPPASADKQREADMLRAVAQYVADSVDTAPVSMMAQQAISAAGKVSLEEDESGSPYIRLELPFNRAWASVEKALAASSFDVSDRDRGIGTFFIRYEEQEEEGGGWFSDWWVSDDESEEDAADTGWFGGWLFGGEGEPETDEVLTEQDFVVTVRQQDEGVAFITIARRDGIELANAQAGQLLSVIKSNIN